jgi:hypothetical protein
MSKNPYKSDTVFSGSVPQRLNPSTWQAQKNNKNELYRRTKCIIIGIKNSSTDRGKLKNGVRSELGRALQRKPIH